ncbi:MAG: flagellar M-ring protein FliF [Deltaproteobacteria bacterium]|nr:flagellar M-ring protein FliF [Deltaproteobacteria bacterium]
MEPLLKQLRELPGKLPFAVKLLVVLALAGLAAAAAIFSAASTESYQYAFTNLTAEDGSEAAGTLKSAGIPFRMEAGGTALAVPGTKVYDARLLLAAQGIPRGGGVGFELFDRGDLGISEFTQRVNLRRAIEGELARTIGRLASVRSARVHVTMPEKSLFRDEDRKASAAVVLALQPGRTLEDREVAGIRHLVASAVPGLSAGAVAVVDGKGSVLSSDAPWGEATSYQRRLERDLQQRIVDLLEQAVGPGAVVARVTATVDAAEVQSTAETVDPDQSALRSERKVAQTQQQDAQGPAGVAGAAANQPLQATQIATGSVNRGSSSTQDEIRNYDVSRTTTTTVQRMPRLRRLSVAVLVDGVGGKPRPEAEVARLGDLARRAVGFDPARGDELDISSSPFTRSEDGALAAATPAPAPSPFPPTRWLVAGGGGLLALLVLAALLLGRRRASSAAQPVLVPGVSIAQLEAGIGSAAGTLAAQRPPQLADPNQQVRDRARALVQSDPGKAAQILKAWMSEDQPNA